METADVVIAGGGIMGCALAYQLAKKMFEQAARRAPAPAAALLLTQLLLDRRSEIDLAPFAFTRFARGSLVRERNVI